MTWNLGAGLEGKVVLVTGAAGGIGWPVAEAFAAAGSRVAAVDINSERLEDLLREIGSPKRHLALTADIRDLGKHECLVDRVRAEMGRCDVLVNVAAVLRRANSIDEVEEADWDFQHDLNLKATFFLSRAVSRMMRRGRARGSIINFSSQGWWSGGFGGSVVYSATKGGIVSMTRGLARTLAPDGIRVNAIAPGLVETPMMLDGISKSALNEMLEQVPLKRLARPEEMAGAVVFLASDYASYITGATINISGGFLMY